MKKRSWLPLVGLGIFIALITYLYKKYDRGIEENVTTDGANAETTPLSAEEEPSLKTLERLLKRQDLSMRRSNWITFAAFGGSIILVGLTLFINKQTSASNIFPSDDIFLISFGFAVMIVAYLGSYLEGRTDTVSTVKARRWFTIFRYFLITGAASIAATLIVLKLLPSLHVVAFFFVPLAFLSVILAIIFLARGLWILVKGKQTEAK
jgi:hypothetical protein